MRTVHSNLKQLSKDLNQYMNFHIFTFMSKDLSSLSFHSYALGDLAFE